MGSSEITGVTQTRDDAEAICQAFGSDSQSKVHLTSIHSDAENTFVYEVLCPNRCWIGLHDKEASDVVGSEAPGPGETGCTESTNGYAAQWCFYNDNPLGETCKLALTFGSQSRILTRGILSAYTDPCYAMSDDDDDNCPYSGAPCCNYYGWNDMRDAYWVNPDASTSDYELSWMTGQPNDWWPWGTQDCTEYYYGDWNDRECDTSDYYTGSGSSWSVAYYDYYSHVITYTCKVKAGCGDGTWYDDSTDTCLNCPRGTYGATVNLDDEDDCTSW